LDKARCRLRAIEYRRDHRFAWNRIGKRKVIATVRKRGANSLPTVSDTESLAASFIRARIAKGTVVHADEAAFWDNLHELFKIKRINHQEAYSLDGACTDMAEGCFSRPRRAEIDIDLISPAPISSATRERCPSKRRVVVTP
jgi:hypothetical protein